MASKKDGRWALALATGSALFSWSVYSANVHAIVILQSEISGYSVELGIPRKQCLWCVSLHSVETQKNRLLLVVRRWLKKANDIITLRLKEPAGLGQLLAIGVDNEIGPAAHLVDV